MCDWLRLGLVFSSRTRQVQWSYGYLPLPCALIGGSRDRTKAGGYGYRTGGAAAAAAIAGDNGEDADNKYRSQKAVPSNT